ncbi:MAG: HAMP domain-containing histidine kinase, partial [Campylobacteraceae bacterium]|nr:HAMP domain-containing histidine kinase [Campylobacteraceae bacterium]
MFWNFIKTNSIKVYSPMAIFVAAFIMLGAGNHQYADLESEKSVKQNKHLNIEDFKSVLYSTEKTSLFMQEEMLKIPKSYPIFISYDTLNAKNTPQMAAKAQNIYSSFDNFIDYNLYISVGIYIITLCSFTLFTIIANNSYRRFKIKREYEKILFSRMNETGELMSIVNHQIKQPINTLLLITSSIMDRLSKKESLDTDDLIEKLKLSKNNILLINKTIDTFRNFYKLDSMITEFELKSCIENILYITRSELILSNITIQMDTSNIEKLKIRSVENFIQQILLVLIQNAKEAIVPLEVIKQLPRRKIEISFAADNKFAHIFVSDFGEGINEDMKKILFTKLKSSAKSKEGGIGLFFSKKLA